MVYPQINQISSCDTLVIDTITFTGLEKTKTWVLILETRILKGETILLNNLDQKVREIETDLIRTNLFSTVDVKYVVELTGH